MPTGVIFSRVKVAREALRERCQELIDLYHRNAKAAMEAGEFDVARQSLEFLLKHLPKDEEGLNLLDQDIDKPKGGTGAPSTPTIQIGFALGGMSPNKALPPKPEPEVIEIEPEEDDD